MRPIASSYSSGPIVSVTLTDGLGSEPEAHALWTLLNDNRVNKLGRVDQLDNKVIVTKSPRAAVPDALGSAPKSAHAHSARSIANPDLSVTPSGNEVKQQAHHEQGNCHEQERPGVEQLIAPRHVGS